MFKSVSHISPSRSFRIIFDVEAGYSDIFNQPVGSFSVASRAARRFRVGVGLTLGLVVGRDRGIRRRKNLLFRTRTRPLCVLTKYHRCEPMSTIVLLMSHLLVSIL